MNTFRLYLICITGLALHSSMLQSFAQNSFAEEIYGTNATGRITSQATAATNVATIQTKPSSTSTNSRFAKVASEESKDFGVAATNALRGDPMHAPTPTRIEGGQVISTEALHAMYEKKEAFIVFDVLGGQQILPNAQNAIAASRAGSFMDATQREFENYLKQVTQDNKDLPLIFYCQSVECWMSYNACLRAIKLGYKRVCWYRGGIEAWQSAGLPTQYRQNSGNR
jgi:rhodanese-related sulfurtransferase